MEQKRQKKSGFFRKNSENTNRELRKMSREQLLTLLLSVSRENEELRAELEDKEKELADRKIILEHAGSIADAAVEVNRIFETAQRTADDYIEGVKKSYHPVKAVESKKTENQTTKKIQVPTAESMESVKEEERVDKKTENPVEELLDPEKSIGNEKKKKSEKKYLKRNKQKKKKGKVRKHDHGES